MIPLKEYVQGPAGLPSLLNYYAFVDAGTLLNHDGSLMACFYYSGPDMDSSLGQEEDALAAHVNNLFIRFGTGWAVQTDFLRVPTSDYPDKHFFNNPTSVLLENNQRDVYRKAGAHYENIYAITLTYMPSIIDNKKVHRIFVRNQSQERQTDLEYLVNSFHVKLDEFEEFFSNKFSVKRMTSSEMMTFLNKCISGERGRVPLPECPIFINHYVGAHEFVAGHDPMIDDKYVGMLTTTGFPAIDFSGIMNILSALPFEYRVSSRFLFLDVVDTKNILKEYENKYAANKYSLAQMIAGALGHDPRSNPDAANRAVMTQIEEIKAAEHLVGLGDVNYGYFTQTVSVFDENQQHCQEKIKDIRRILNNNGYHAIVERMNSVEAFLGSLPGETVKNVRKPVISTQNLANMMPLTDTWTGLEFNPCQYYPEGSPALFYAATMGTTPFRCHLHVGDVGHTLVLGPTGAGKSVLLSHIANSALRYKDAQVYVFDMGYSQYALTQAIGGRFYDILGDDSDLAFCPLAWLEEQAEQMWGSGWIEQLVQLQGITIDPGIRADIDRAIRDTSKSPGKTLSDLYLNIQNREVQTALNQFVSLKNGHMAGLLDAEKDGFRESFFQTFEISNLMTKDYRLTTPVLLNLFHRIERSMDGRPTFVIIDEGWLIMLHPVFMQNWIEFLRTARKRNACIVLATQSLSDIVKSSSFSIINESCPTKIFLPNPTATDPDCKNYYEEFGLNERQLEIVSQAQGKRHYYFSARNLGDRLIDLGLSRLELAFYGVGSSVGDRAIIRRLIAAHGADWVYDWLQIKGLSEEAHEWTKLKTMFPTTPQGDVA